MRWGLLALCAACGGNPAEQPDAPIGPEPDAAVDAACTTVWTEDATNPSFPFQAFGGAVWNDPWVIREGGQYRMWLSNGAGHIGVSIYEARSPDGLSWTLQSSVGTPQLAAGPAAHDAVSVETPSVVKLGATYHMFYTAVPDNGFINYSIGHATSSDGVTWTKRPSPAIPKPTTPNDWGWLGVAEPGAVVKDGTIYLYYAMVRCREGFDGSQCTGPDPKVARGIGVATSTDGTSFAIGAEPVLVQTASYPSTMQFEGYSTPAAVLDGDTIHLFYDVVKNEGGFRQVALAHATTVDGTTITEVEPDFLTRDAWTSFEIRSPTAVARGDGTFELWFAGNNGNDPQQPGFQIGIGRATSRCE